MKAYGSKVSFDAVEDPGLAEHILADPQTSGGLLIAVAPDHREEVETILHNNGLSAFAQPIGSIQPIKRAGIFVEVN